MDDKDDTINVSEGLLAGDESAGRKRIVPNSRMIAPGARDIIETKFLHVTVETTGALTLGRTVMDVARRSGLAPNCHVAFGVNRANSSICS